MNWWQVAIDLGFFVWGIGLGGFLGYLIGRSK